MTDQPETPAEEPVQAEEPAQAEEPEVHPEEKSEQNAFPVFGMPVESEPQAEEPVQAEVQAETEQETQAEQTQDWPFQGGFGFYNQQSDQAQGGFPAFDMTDQGRRARTGRRACTDSRTRTGRRACTDSRTRTGRRAGKTV